MHVLEQLEPLLISFMSFDRYIFLKRIYLSSSDHNDGKSRALDNIGRSYARLGNYEKAVERYVKLKLQ